MNGHYPPTYWVPGLIDLIARRPELAGIGFADVALELAAAS